MGFFSFRKKQPDPSPTIANVADRPYKDSATNLIYNLLFCDDLALYKTNTKQPYGYPFDKLFADKTTIEELQKIAEDATLDPRDEGPCLQHQSNGEDGDLGNDDRRQSFNPLNKNMPCILLNWFLASFTSTSILG